VQWLIDNAKYKAAFFTFGFWRVRFISIHENKVAGIIAT
jgi:hypothetical protein